MRPFQIFAAMSAEGAVAFFRKLADDAPAVFSQAILAASNALRSRPQYLLKQPFEKRAAAVRQALSRVSADAVAEEMLAVYFLECRKELLVEWLDLLGVEHEEGTLKQEAPAEPAKQKLDAAVKKFRAAAADADRELLLRAFAAQSSIAWPALDAQLELRLGTEG
ncbi:MAG: hypothetical protein V3T33_02435 [Myxococcota bacterium]